MPLRCQGESMNLEVRLFARLREGRFQQASMELQDGETLADLLNKLRVSASEVGIFLVNGRHAPQDRPLKEGDTVALFPPIAGG